MQVLENKNVYLVWEEEFELNSAFNFVIGSREKMAKV